jgi:hypothetical protein
MDRLLAKLSEQQAVLSKQNEALQKTRDDNVYALALDHGSSSNSLPITPATDTFPSTAPTTRPASATLNETRSKDDELLRLKLELAQAQNNISRLSQELNQTRVVKQEPDASSVNTSCLPGSTGRDNAGWTALDDAQARTAKQEPDSAVLVAPRISITTGRDNAGWSTLEDAHSDTSDAMSATGFNRARAVWGSTRNFASPGLPEPAPTGHWPGPRGFNQGYMDPNGPYNMADGYRNERLTPDPEMLVRPSGGRRGNRFDGRYGSPHQFGGGYGGYSPAPSQFEPMQPMTGPMGPPPMSHGPAGFGMYSQYQHGPMGTPLSPHATEFTSGMNWRGEVCT